MPANVAASPFAPRYAATQPVGPSNVPPLAHPNAITGPDPSTGIDAHLPPIDAYELDAIAASAEDDNTPPPPAPDPEAQPAPESAGDAAPLQAAAVEALFAAGNQNSAAEQLEETTWTIAEGEVRVQTSLSKPMVNTIFRPEAQAIIRAAITKSGAAGMKLIFLPGNVNDKPKAAAKKPRTGSAQAKALEHPTVQAAQRLFNAEVTNVFDLRKD